jgi:hypothetical protein
MLYQIGVKKYRLLLTIICVNRNFRDRIFNLILLLLLKYHFFYIYNKKIAFYIKYSNNKFYSSFISFIILRETFKIIKTSIKILLLLFSF